jgi:SET domain-containing protein
MAKTLQAGIVEREYASGCITRSAKQTIDGSSFICQSAAPVSLESASNAMPPRPFRIGRARTGLGLFATRPIKKNSRIVEYKGPLLATKEANKREQRGSLYLYEVNRRWTIDGSPRNNISRYANHSCNPNADSYSVKLKVFLRALRNIKPGEEIVYDYGIDYLKNVIGRSNCQCSRCVKRRARRAKELRLKRERRAARLANKRSKNRSTKRTGRKK